MIATAQPQKMSVEAYLEWEPCQELRYEYVNGEVYAMTGGSLPHNDIAVNLLTALYPHIRAQGCRINIADAKVNVAPPIYRYPDLVVSCDERDRTAVNAIHYPKLIVEVLSPGTEAFDRGNKFKEYRSLPSLEEYVLISSTQIGVEIYRRGEGRLWLYYPYQDGDTLKLESIGFELPIALLYDAVQLES
ncbi:Uma2 family endonuclease [Pseudanabaena sp. FACHB-2040]|uniref:Uma2 family endonuclease n=1 Tax=Pseudanabaena sp. FACHB-2040 TaxID=2692859 RepID=UPI0016850DCB|nr:Uma2 family endonuclease [Pseudanabaena sp. FACHB-2040]MBD2258381.1 Uma2 family endonuclease [Pseudanabaena sp. FACHB-2040]